MLSPTFFLNSVVSLIRLGRTGIQAYKTNLLEKEDIIIFTGSFSPEQLQGTTIRKAVFGLILQRVRDAGDTAPSGQYGHLFNWERDIPEVIGRDTNPDWDIAVTRVCEELNLFTPQEIPPGAGLPIKQISPVLVQTHREWLLADEHGRPLSAWGRFGLSIVDVALDFVAMEPGLVGPGGLGLGKDAGRIVNALVPNLAHYLRPELFEERGGKGAGEVVGEALVQAALETLVQTPDLITTKEQWRPIVAAAVGSVHGHVDGTLSAGERLFARDQVRAFAEGPFVQAMAAAVDRNADTLLRGKLADDHLLGAMARNLLGHVGGMTPDDVKLGKLFSPQGAALVFDSAVETVAERPDLVFSGAGEGAERGRMFLSRVAGVIEDVPRPFNREDMATDLALMTLDIAREFAISQVLTDGDDRDWDDAFGDVAEHLIGTLFVGFSDALRPANGGTGARGDILERIFSRSQALSVLKIMATHVAATPGLLVGENGSPEVRNMARSVAGFLAADENNLMTGEQWKSVITLSLDLAAKNPGAIFNLGAEDPDTPSIAAGVITDLLGFANRAINTSGSIRAPGQYLTGAVLQNTIEATLQAMSSRAAKQMSVEARTEAHAAVTALADRLMRFSRGEEGQFGLSADEWVRTYRHFITHVLEHGSQSVLVETYDQYIRPGDIAAIIHEFQDGAASAVPT